MYTSASGTVEIDVEIDADELIGEIDLDDAVDTWFGNNEENVQEKIADAVEAEPLRFLKAITDGYGEAVHNRDIAVSGAADAEAVAVAWADKAKEARALVNKIMEDHMTSLDAELHDEVEKVRKQWADTVLREDTTTRAGKVTEGEQS